MPECKATRDAYGNALIDLGKKRQDFVVLDADLSRSSRTDWFQREFPDRFINVGIAEQNLIGIAAGLALGGIMPFATTYAIFIARAVDQIRQAVAFSRTNVKIVATHAGLAASYDGGSHQGTEDVALMRAIPGMTIVSPCDYVAAYEAVSAIADYEGPVYLRLQKEASPVITEPGTPFHIGRARVLRKGRDVALIAHGSLSAEALLAAAELQQHGVLATVVDVGTIKPLDTNTLLEAASNVKLVFTIEEHNIVGGLRDAVAAALCGPSGVQIEAIGLNDVFGESGSWRELRSKYQLDAPGILARVLSRIGYLGAEHTDAESFGI